MIDIRQFKASDMTELLSGGIVECGITHAGNELLSELAAVREASGKCSSGYVDGKIVGSGGVDILWTGVGEVWMLGSIHAKDNPVQSMRLIRAIFNRIIKENNLWRIQTTGRVGALQSLRVIEILGFTQTCLLEKYGADKSDYYLYSMVI